MRNAFNLLLVTLACFDSTYVSININLGDAFYQENTFLFCYYSSLVASWRAFARSSSWWPTSTSSSFPIFYGPLRKSSSLAPSSWRWPSPLNDSSQSTTPSTIAKPCTRPTLWPRESLNTCQLSLSFPLSSLSLVSSRQKLSTKRKWIPWPMLPTKYPSCIPPSCELRHCIRLTSIGVDWSSSALFPLSSWSTSTQWFTRWVNRTISEDRAKSAPFHPFFSTKGHQGQASPSNGGQKSTNTG